MDKILFDIAPDVKRHGDGAIVEMLLIPARVSLRAYGSLCASGDGTIDDVWHAIRIAPSVTRWSLRLCLVPWALTWNAIQKPSRKNPRMSTARVYKLSTRSLPPVCEGEAHGTRCL